MMMISQAVFHYSSAYAYKRLEFDLNKINLIILSIVMGTFGIFMLIHGVT